MGHPAKLSNILAYSYKTVVSSVSKKKTELRLINNNRKASDNTGIVTLFSKPNRYQDEPSIPKTPNMELVASNVM